MKAIRSISTLLLVILLLVSSTSLMVGFHICMGQVKNVALFTKADGCEKERDLPPCHRHQKDPCCEDETMVHKADDFKASLAHHLIALAELDIAYPLVPVSEVIPVSPLSRIHPYLYEPPLRPCDLTIRHQVFLI